MFETAFDRLRAFHDKNARAILAGIATLLLPMMVLTTIATFDNWQQSREIKAATTAQDELLICFDEYAAASATTSKAVRDASVLKDIATANRDDALNAEGKAFKRLVRRITEGKATKADLEALGKTLEVRDRAARELDAAQAALDTARRENPVPDPPSDFCDVKGDTPTDNHAQ